MKIIFVRNAEYISRKSRSSILVHFDKDRYKEVNIRDIEALIILGSKALLESGVISLLSSFNIPVAIISKLGTSLLSTHILTHYNEVRRVQYTMNEDERQRIMLEILFARFRGLSNILKYYGCRDPGLCSLEELEKKNVSLLWWEALNSRIYWEELLKLLPKETLETLRNTYGFEGRKPKASDPFNKSISLLYSTLYTIGLRALVAAGLDPTEGLHHKSRYSTPLVFDYVEMYKPVAIHTVLKVFRSKEEIEISKDGNLTKESIEILMKEFFKIMRSRIRGTRLTPYRSIYINACRLARSIKGETKVKYTFSYNPKKLALHT
jgi:CRISPR-associated protein Cas1